MSSLYKKAWIILGALSAVILLFVLVYYFLFPNMKETPLWIWILVSLALILAIFSLIFLFIFRADSCVSNIMIYREPVLGFYIPENN